MQTRRVKIDEIPFVYVGKDQTNDWTARVSSAAVGMPGLNVEYYPRAVELPEFLGEWTPEDYVVRIDITTVNSRGVYAPSTRIDIFYNTSGHDY